MLHARNEEYICSDALGEKCNEPTGVWLISEELGQREDKVKSKLVSEAEKKVSGETLSRPGGGQVGGGGGHEASPRTGIWLV